jgi:hypothetical protein
MDNIEHDKIVKRLNEELELVNLVTSELLEKNMAEERKLHLVKLIQEDVVKNLYKEEKRLGFYFDHVMEIELIVKKFVFRFIDHKNSYVAEIG